jgi:hypothetical protein
MKWEKRRVIKRYTVSQDLKEKMKRGEERIRNNNIKLENQKETDVPTLVFDPPMEPGRIEPVS